MRLDEALKLVARAKVVHPDFVQQIDSHWSTRSMQTNKLLSGAIW